MKAQVHVIEHSSAPDVSTSTVRTAPLRSAPARAARGEQPFVKLFIEHEPALRAFIYSQVVNWADMNEILQQTSIVLWEKFDKFKPGTDFRSWAFKIARYEVLNYLRKQRRSRLVFSDELVDMLGSEAEEDRAQEDRLEEQRHALSDCLRKLPPEQGQLIEDFYKGERSMKELARVYRKSAMALYQRIHRLRVVLLECVQKELKESEHPA